MFINLVVALLCCFLRWRGPPSTSMPHTAEELPGTVLRDTYSHQVTTLADYFIHQSINAPLWATIAPLPLSLAIPDE